MVSRSQKVVLSTIQALVLLVIIAPVALLFIAPVVVTIRNESGLVVSNVTVTVWEKRIEFGDLQPGRTYRRWFRNTGGDGHYELRAAGADGGQIEMDAGYITGEYIYGNAEFTLRSNATVVFEDSYFP